MTTGPGQKRQTLCWDCSKAATGECAWSQRDDFGPVNGWKAIPTEINVSQKDIAIRSYIVIECPDFDRDSREFGQRRIRHA